MEKEDFHLVVQEEVEKAVSESSSKLLADLDSLISTKLSSIQEDLSRSQIAVSKQQIEAINSLKLVKPPVFKKKGNEEQFKFNLEVCGALESARSNLDAPLTEQSLQNSRDSMAKGIELIDHRQKLIRLADQSEAGWLTVHEYESHELADNEEDELAALFKLMVLSFCLLTGLNLSERIRNAVGSDDAELQRLSSLLPGILVGARSDNTNKKYWGYFNKWMQFAKDRGNIPAMPGHPIHVALYLTSLIDKNASCSIISSSFYAIKWAHNVSGEADPTIHPFVVNVLESAKRSCIKPVIKKDPVSSEVLITLCQKYKDSKDLLIIRDLSMMLLCFCGFFRHSELVNLRCNEISMYSDYIACKISKSKTDQYRQGSEVLISKLESIACPFSMFNRYINLSGLNLASDMFVFRPVVRSKLSCKLSGVNKSLSYTRTREVILGRLKEVDQKANFGLHSLRAGGASAAANANVLDRCWKRHGRWRSETAKDGYVVDSIESRLKVSQNLGL